MCPALRTSSSETRLLFLLVRMNVLVLVCRKVSSLETVGEEQEKMSRKCGRCLLQKMRMIQARRKDHW
ncbi:hypothetical protein OIU85_029304 [Salix viminalis]|uniref:Secreted protein n=1 Tax=Salix viminalis TaxID=40686 RepID=A0A9Q0QB28_SALVM|nr:hypothetical protein OIU85_029304 [Salix viminalis]